MGKIINESFVFTFKDQKNRNLLYVAQYFSSNKLHVSIGKDLTDDKPISIDEKLKDKDGWNTFNDNATFKDILKDIKTPQPKLHNLDKLEASNLKEFLEQIRDEPYYLINPIVLVSFEHILTQAKTNPDKDVRNEYRNALTDHFIPKATTSKIIMPPIQAPLTLLKMLANHLSEKCLRKLEYDGYEQNQCKDEMKIKLDCYGTIIKWASKNEPRICKVSRKGVSAMMESMKQKKVNIMDESAEDFLKDYALNRKELHDLIYTPAEYATNMIRDYFNISKSTINRHP